MCEQCGSSDMNDPTLRSMVDRAMTNPSSLSPDQSRLRMLLLGDPQSVWQRIVELHQANLAEIGAWSDLMPIPNSNEVLSIHTTRRRPFPDIIDRAGR